MRVIVAENAPMLRRLYRVELCSAGVDVVADTASGDELVALTRVYRPDAILVDISLRDHHGGDGHKDDDGLVAVEQLRQEFPSLGVLVFSVHMSVAYLERIQRIGADHIGYLGKDRVGDFTVVVGALRKTADGEVVIDPGLWSQLVRRRTTRSLLDQLGPRKREALGLMAQALSNRAIAERMGVTVGTVEEYLADAFHVLGIAGPPDNHKRVGAVLAWLRESGGLT